VLPIGTDCGDEIGRRHVARDGDLSQSLPERVFQADACLATVNGSRSGELAGVVQRRWKTSVPRVFTPRPSGAPRVAIHLAAMVVGLTKRPDQTAVTLQSDVQVLDVWNATRGPRTPPARS
jgi:hypothetical protein